MPNMSSKALSIALQGRLSVFQAPRCVQGAFQGCEEQRRLLTIGKRLEAKNISRSHVRGTRRLSKEDRALGFGMRGIHTGKEGETEGKRVEEKVAEEKGAEEKGVKENGAIENGADKENNNVIHDPSSPSIWRTRGNGKPPQKVARQNPESAPAALLAAITGKSTLPYAIGTDLCYVLRIQRILSEHEQLLGKESEIRAPKFWLRVLTPFESSFSGWRLMGTEQRRTEFIAGRWAAKKAIIKAWQSAYPERRKLLMQNIVILSSKQCKSIALGGSTDGATAVMEEAPIVVEKEPSVMEEVPIVAEKEPIVVEKEPSVMEEVPIVAEKEPAEVESVEADVNTKGPESTNVTSGPPRAFVRVRGGKPWEEVSVSISHDGDFASAVALVTIHPPIKRKRSVPIKDYTDVRRILSRRPII